MIESDSFSPSEAGGRRWAGRCPASTSFRFSDLGRASVKGRAEQVAPPFRPVRPAVLGSLPPTLMDAHLATPEC